MTRIPADRERWQRIEAILDEALELPSEDRGAFLDLSCQGDDGLRAEIEALLEADEKSGGFLESSARDFASTLIAEIRHQGPARGAAALEGRRLGPYRVERTIGGGGMGVVYEARDTRLHRQVALKLLPESWSRDPDAKRRFQREARAASSLDHPNICTVHDIGETDDGRVYIVMAHYKGETLERKLQGGALPVEDARRLAIQLAGGLERAHEAGIIHRDVKPGNVMVTDRGEAKLLDFGIAKVSGEAGLTRTGTSPGTPAYMSPEQARGEPSDHRSDVWALGVLLYEMIAGRRPFWGDNAQAVLYSILEGEAEPLERVCPDTPPSVTRVVAQAMAKDPAERYQSVARMREDLENGSASAPPPRATGVALWTRLAAAGIVVALGTGAGWWTLRDTGSPSSPVPATEAATEAASKTTVAVLPFRNLTRDPDVDWLRSGLAEMLVTDLSQSPEITVLAPGSLAAFLGDLGGAGGEPSPEELRKLVQRTGVGTVLVGSFVRQGERLRVNFKILASASAAIVTGDSLEGRLESGLFAMVDQLSVAIRQGLEVPRRTAAESVEEVTTSSLEAWRYYSEGRRLFLQSKITEAIPLYEKAVSVDPEFALALADLGNLNASLGYDRRAREYTRRALRHIDRLPVQQRYVVEGEYYSATWASFGRAAESFRQGLELFPDRMDLRAQLAGIYADLERYEEAIREYQELVDRQDRFAGTYWAMATVHGALDRFETGHRILEDYARRHDGNWFAQLALGWHLTQWGRLDQALDPLQRAERLRPGDVYVRNGWWRLRILREEWAEALADAESMAAASDPYGRWRGQVSAARSLLFTGRSREALGRLEAARHAYPEPDAYTALSRCWRARLLLQTGDAAGALSEATAAQREAPRQWPELEALFVAALARQALGQPAEADRLAARLRERAAENPNVVEDRQLLHLEGRLALARGDVAGALEALGAAAERLPPRGLPIHAHVLPDHVPLWYALGEAELSAGRPDQALAWFRRIADSGVEHVERPVLYVRSFYRLGRIYESLGESGKAASAFGRFFRYWQDGDLDRDEVEAVADQLDG